jgi:hypothetical protein
MIPIKTHQMPGDVTKQEKAAMLEGKHKDRKRSKSFKKTIKSRERAVLRERARREIAPV